MIKTAKPKIDKKALWEAIKEPLRLLVLAILPFAITFVGGYDMWWAYMGVLLLRGLDKYLHKSGVKKGLTRF